MAAQQFFKLVIKDLEMEIPKNITESFLKQDQPRQNQPDEEQRQKSQQCLLHYYHAIKLARQRRYTDAELLLLEAGHHEELRPVVLDLRAKMFAQQHRFSEAEACWQEALSLDPGNKQYRKALDALASNGQYTFLSRFAMATLIIAVSMIGVLAVFIAGFNLSANRYNNLQRQSEEYEQRTITSLRSLSQKVDSQNRVSADRQKNLEDRLISMAGLQRQNLESRKELSASIDGVSQRIALLEANTEQHITDLNEKMNRDNTAITKITRMLFAPINFFFNLEEDDNSSTQNK